MNPAFQSIHLFDHLKSQFEASKPADRGLDAFLAFCRKELEEHPVMLTGIDETGTTLTLSYEVPITVRLRTAAQPGTMQASPSFAVTGHRWQGGIGSTLPTESFEVTGRKK